MSGETRKHHLHGTETTTRWVHKHRFLAKWLFKLLIAGVAALLYYLRKQEREIESEQRRR